MGGDRPKSGSNRLDLSDWLDSQTWYLIFPAWKTDIISKFRILFSLFRAIWTRTGLCISDTGMTISTAHERTERLAKSRERRWTVMPPIDSVLSRESPKSKYESCYLLRSRAGNRSSRWMRAALPPRHLPFGLKVCWQTVNTAHL